MLKITAIGNLTNDVTLKTNETTGKPYASLMLTSLLIGLIVMVLYKPRTWCAFCPMGTMTQGICKLKNKE